jgi:hypothetical protein
MDSPKYAVYIEWPHALKDPMVRFFDKSMRPLTDLAQAIVEAKRWRVIGQTEQSTRVMILEVALKM